MELLAQFSLLFNCQCFIDVFLLEMASVLHMITCDDFQIQIQLMRGNCWSVC